MLSKCPGPRSERRSRDPRLPTQWRQMLSCWRCCSAGWPAVTSVRAAAQRALKIYFRWSIFECRTVQGRVSRVDFRGSIFGVPIFWRVRRHRFHVCVRLSIIAIWAQAFRVPWCSRVSSQPTQLCTHRTFALNRQKRFAWPLRKDDCTSYDDVFVRGRGGAMAPTAGTVAPTSSSIALPCQSRECPSCQGRRSWMTRPNREVLTTSPRRTTSVGDVCSPSWRGE